MLGSFFETVEGIKETLALQNRFQCQGQMINDAQNYTTINYFYGGCIIRSRSQSFVFEKRRTKSSIEEDNGVNPVEHALAVLNISLTTSLIYNAAAKRINLYENTLNINNLPQS